MILLKKLFFGMLCWMPGRSFYTMGASMSLPKFDTQGSLFESLGSIAADLFDDKDKYKLFARKVWPLLAAQREELAQCYKPENGRPGIEPVVLLGVLIFQFLERVPDRQATELVKYHLGWKLALNLKLGAEGFHPTSLVHFRQRLVEAGKSDLALRAVLGALVRAVLGALEQEGFIAKRSKQRLDSTHILGAVARLSALECRITATPGCGIEVPPQLNASALESLPIPVKSLSNRDLAWRLLTLIGAEKGSRLRR
jgi:hypothetical protein